MYSNNLHETCLLTTFLTQTYIIPTEPPRTEYINIIKLNYFKFLNCRKYSQSQILNISFSAALVYSKSLKRNYSDF